MAFVVCQIVWRARLNQYGISGPLIVAIGAPGMFKVRDNFMDILSHNNELKEPQLWEIIPCEVRYCMFVVVAWR